MSPSKHAQTRPEADMRMAADGSTLLATNFNSRDVELIDLSRLDAAEK